MPNNNPQDQSNRTLTVEFLFDTQEQCLFFADLLFRYQAVWSPLPMSEIITAKTLGSQFIGGGLVNQGIQPTWDRQQVLREEWRPVFDSEKQRTAFIEKNEPKEIVEPYLVQLEGWRHSDPEKYKRMVDGVFAEPSPKPTTPQIQPSPYSDEAKDNFWDNLPIDISIGKSKVTLKELAVLLRPYLQKGAQDSNA